METVGGADIELLADVHVTSPSVDVHVTQPLASVHVTELPIAGPVELPSLLPSESADLIGVSHKVSVASHVDLNGLTHKVITRYDHK